MSHINKYADFIKDQQKNRQYSTTSIQESQQAQLKKFVVLSPGSIVNGKIVDNEETRKHGFVPGSHISTGTGSGLESNMYTLVHRHGMPRRKWEGPETEGRHSAGSQSNKRESLDADAEYLNNSSEKRKK